MQHSAATELPDRPIELHVSADGSGRRHLTAEQVRHGVDAIRADGVVVLVDAIDPNILITLRERMMSDLTALLERKDSPFNWNVGNLQQDPPPFPPFLFPEILFNEPAVAITRAVLGPGVKNSLYSGNTCMPSTYRQPVHADTGQLWPNLQIAHPATQLVVNIPLVDVDARNGSTEIWLGTHHDTTVAHGTDIKVPEDLIDYRRAQRPPIQPTLKLGSILIRDIRVWHAGMPNHTQTPRPMLAMVHNVSWLDTGNPLRFPKGTESFFNHPELKMCCQFVEGDIDYIHTPQAYEFTAKT